MTTPDPDEQARPAVADCLDPTGLRILDVACAAGALGALLKQRGAREVVGLERRPDIAARARARLDQVIEVDLDAAAPLPLPAASFDAVICADVLERLVDPWRVLRELERVITPDGLLVVSLPNVRHESVLLPLLIDGVFSYDGVGILDRSHLRFFTFRDAVKLLAEAGFAIEEPTRAIHRAASPYLEAAVAFVEQLGGDAAQFRAEATVVHYLLRARPMRAISGPGAS